MSGHVVVVGAGMAAVRLAEHLATRGAARRGGGSQAPVTLLGDEVDAPYNRILLSAALEGTHDASLLELHPRDWYAEQGIDLRTGTRVARIDRDASRVVLESGEQVGYDRLVLATGAVPTLPPVRGLVRSDGSLDGRVHPFRRLADCRDLDAAVRRLLERRSPDRCGAAPARPVRAVVVGGGLLGLQVARALAVRGVAVEVVEGGDHLLRSHVEAPAGALLARDLRRLGTEVYTGTRASRLTADGLLLDSGHTLTADLVVLTAGGRPATALARRAGLVVRRGVVVDDRLTTSDPRIHAVGDCAEHDGVVTGLVPPAWEQAERLVEVLGPEVHGGAVPTGYTGHRSVARLRATDLDVAVLGDPVTAASTPDARVVEMTNPIAGSHRRIVVRGGRIVAATLVGDLARVGLITGHYDRGTVLGDAEPGALLAADRAPRPTVLPDEAEVCTCAGVTAGAVRACDSLDDVRARTHATTGCGGCADDVRSLLASRPHPTPRGDS